jgi:hypothetical protein
MRLELRLDAKRRVGAVDALPTFLLVSVAEDRGFEPLRAINPTRFPSERHRPLGESSAGEATGSLSGREIAACPGVRHTIWLLERPLGMTYAERSYDLAARATNSYDVPAHSRPTLGRLPIGRGEIGLLDSAPTPRAAVSH